MTSNQLMTAGAIAFAAFAVWQISKKPPGQAIANQPGQQQRDAGLATWGTQQSTQWGDLAQQVSAERFIF